MIDDTHATCCVSCITVPKNCDLRQAQCYTPQRHVKNHILLYTHSTQTLTIDLYMSASHLIFSITNMFTNYNALYVFYRRRGRLSHSDVDPAAPLEAQRRRPLRLCFVFALARFGLQSFFRSLSMINVLYRGGPLRRRPQSRRRTEKPATHEKNLNNVLKK